MGFERAFVPNIRDDVLMEFLMCLSGKQIVIPLDAVLPRYGITQRERGQSFIYVYP